MPRICQICAHPKRQEIEFAVLSGQPTSATAALFRVSQDSLQRHKQGHLPDKLAKSHETKEISDADYLLREMQELRDKVRAGLVAAEREGSGAGIVAFSRELRNTLESYFNITDTIGRREIEPGQGKEMHVVVETYVAPTTCPHCGKSIDPVNVARRTTHAHAGEDFSLTQPRYNAVTFR